MPRRSITPEQIETFLEKLSTSNEGAQKIAESIGIPKTTLWRMLEEDLELRGRYARAKEMQADFLVQEMLDIADDSTNDTEIKNFGDSTVEVENKEWTNRSRLRVDTRKWIASKLFPKKYGDKIGLDLPANVIEVTIGKKE